MSLENILTFVLCRLVVVQQPVRARMCGFGDKVRPLLSTKSKAGGCFPKFGALLRHADAYRTEDLSLHLHAFSCL
jgi:hypothetical protein